MRDGFESNFMDKKRSSHLTFSETVASTLKTDYSRTCFRRRNSPSSNPRPNHLTTIKSIFLVSTLKKRLKKVFQWWLLLASGSLLLKKPSSGNASRKRGEACCQTRFTWTSTLRRPWWSFPVPWRPKKRRMKTKLLRKIKSRKKWSLRS